jgi:hypothetical protein
VAWQWVGEPEDAASCSAWAGKTRAWFVCTAGWARHWLMLLLLRAAGSGRARVLLLLALACCTPDCTAPSAQSQTTQYSSLTPWLGPACVPAAVPPDASFQPGNLPPGHYCSLAVLRTMMCSKGPQRQQDCSSSGTAEPGGQLFRASAFAHPQSPLYKALQAAAGGGSRGAGTSMQPARSSRHQEEQQQRQWYVVPLTTLATPSRTWQAIQTMQLRSRQGGAVLQELLLQEPAPAAALPDAQPADWWASPAAAAALLEHITADPAAGPAASALAAAHAAQQGPAAFAADAAAPGSASDAAAAATETPGGQACAAAAVHSYCTSSQGLNASQAQQAVELVMTSAATRQGNRVGAA